MTLEQAEDRIKDLEQLRDYQKEQVLKAQKERQSSDKFLGMASQKIDQLEKELAEEKNKKLDAESKGHT